jgi:LPPG:FO 2-phospho-L-lactate transferase
VRGVRFEGAESAHPAPGALEAIRGAKAIFIAPSNPIGSIWPILAVRAIRDAVRSAHVPRIGVSPIIGGKSLQPPAAEMMAGLDHDVSVGGVARIYAGLIDTLVIDPADRTGAAEVESAGLRALVCPAVMRDDETRRALALAVTAAAGIS